LEKVAAAVVDQGRRARVGVILRRDQAEQVVAANPRGARVVGHGALLAGAVVPARGPGPGAAGHLPQTGEGVGGALAAACDEQVTYDTLPGISPAEQRTPRATRYPRATMALMLHIDNSKFLQY
jgi:hypothetical protein